MALHLNLNNRAEESSSLYISNIPQVKGGNGLLIIDPQVDFVTGSLSVTGAAKDCENIAQFIRTNLTKLDEIFVTLDCHMKYHVAHPNFWKIKETGKHPQPFTAITHKEIADGKYEPVDQKMKQWVLDYTKSLQNDKRLPGLDAFTLFIWPEHCLIGTPGNNVEPGVMKALHEWEDLTGKCVHYIAKGNNSKTEHYSAMRAEVIVKEDSGTCYNEQLYRDLVALDTIYVAGEAKSHCVNFTVRDIVDRMGDELASRKLILLDGGMSSVTGFEPMGDKFFSDMVDGKKFRVQDISANGKGVEINKPIEKPVVAEEKVEPAPKERAIHKLYRSLKTMRVKSLKL